MVNRAFKAIDILGFAYGRTVLAAASLRQAHALGGPRVQQQVIQGLANLRFQDATLADELLAQKDFKAIAVQVLAMPPSIEASDIPTWIDGFFNDLLLRSDAFRFEVCGAFRRA